VRIGEVASTTGTTTKTLRFYEQVGLLPPADRTAGGYRTYGPDTLARLDFIRRGQAAGLTLTQIRDVLHLRDSGDPPCEHVRQLLRDRLRALDTQLAELHALRETLLELSSASSVVDPGTCSAADVCRYV
jgi:DNA-binding transcriptional MerR regulator